MRDSVQRLFVSDAHNLRECIAVLDRTGKGIVLAVDEGGRLLGTITDGDIRRAILDRIDLSVAVRTLLDGKANSAYPRPITAPVGADHKTLVTLMKRHAVRQLPLLDDAGRVVDLVTLDELLPDQPLPVQVVIMAGGRGSRLRPLTDTLPKPMLPIGDRPVMEFIIEQLRQAGIRRVHITTHYHAEKITEHFGNGQGFGVEINYVAEDRPLGTAGAISLMKKPQEPLLVINADVLTQVNYRALVAHHRKHKADLTVAVRRYDLELPYGIVECEGPLVRELREKPSLGFLVNAGIYLLEPSILKYLPEGQRFDMTELIQVLLANGHRVVGFPIVEYWLDIGRLADYEKAQEDLKERGE